MIVLWMDEVCISLVTIVEFLEVELIIICKWIIETFPCNDLKR